MVPSPLAITVSADASTHTQRNRPVLCGSATPADTVIARGEGTIEGRILDELRGSGGFGYDPLFFVPELGRTTAELSRQAKNRISHRGKALRAIKPRIEDWLRQA